MTNGTNGTPNGTCPNATERLRALLDERGVEWGCKGSTVAWGEDVAEYVFTEYGDGGTILRIVDLTPEQAVEATLGRGTCHVAYKHPEYPCSNDEICSECGASFYFIGEVNYCPNCGAKVVE